MNLLKNELTKQIPVLQKDIKKKLISEKGNETISEVTVAQAYSGLRKHKAFVCDTSSVSADKGLIIRGDSTFLNDSHSTRRSFLSTVNRQTPK